ncbi:MAG: MBL fold metallo-hydrolase [Candidatus Aenigmarchaeota archaeon]|nr:MBL fold metallo-hydrolase [Candidatus Aenigmarchaeota archaeon]
MTKVSFLGACNEVGSSAVLVDTGTEKMVMDYGVKLQEDPVQYPEEVKGKLNSILLTHTHLDHSGAVPYLYHQGQKCPLIGQDITLPFSRMLWYDSIKIAKMEGKRIKFNGHDIRRSVKKFRGVEYRKPFKIGKSRVTSYDAGHIPGSSMFFIENGGKKILYTGDFNTDDTRLLAGCDWDIPKPDVLVTESTYAGKEHPNREEEERKLIEVVNDTIANDGIAVIACFAIARSQEVMLILDNYGIKAPVYVEGMARQATDIVNDHPHLQNEYNSLKRAMKNMNVKYIQHHMQRKKIAKDPCVVITTSGMLSGGAVVYYLKRLHNREDCSLIMTGFQVPDTEGDNLLKTGRYVHEELDFKVKMNVNKFDFSAHSSDSDIISFIQKLSPKKVFCVHGERTDTFANDLNSKGFDAVSPKKGEEFTF